MRRREFIKYTAGSFGLSMVNGIQAAVPCPPSFSDSGVQTTVCSRVSLADTVSGLVPGQFAFFEGPPTEIGNFGISWQHVSAFWDKKNHELQFMAKAQGGGSASHWIYSEESRSWRATTRDLVPGQAGHVWTITFDPETGDYYYLDFEKTNFVRRMDRVLEAGNGMASSPWRETSSPEINMRSQRPENAIGFHPNLYGVGDGGLIVWCGLDLLAWRKSTNAWEVMQSYSGGDYHATQRGGSVYIPGLDTLLLGTGADKTKFMVVSAGSDGQLRSNAPAMRVAPIKVFGDTNGSLPWGKLIRDPTNDSRVLILEAGPKQTGLRVWSSIDAGQEWKLEGFDHPFHNLPWTGADAGAWTVASCESYGILWGMAYDGKESVSILWRPPY